MAKIISQDPQTGFVTLQLDDGRTTIAPAQTAFDAFPDIRDPLAGTDDLVNPFSDAPGGPVPDMPLPSGPSQFNEEWSAAQPAPVAPQDPMMEARQSDQLMQQPPAPEVQPGTPPVSNWKSAWNAAQPLPNENLGVTSSVPPIPAQPQAQFLDSPLGGPMQRTPHGDFGMPRSGGARSHEGEDYVAPMGAPVLAMGDGVVEAAGSSIGDEGRGGQRVRIRYDDGRKSSFMHLSEITVGERDRVKAGQMVGKVGNTGTSSSGPHLHAKWELPDGTPVPFDTWRGSAGAAGTAGSDLGSLSAGGRFSVGLNTANITPPPGAAMAPVQGGFNALGGQLKTALDAKREALMAQGGVRMAMADEQVQFAQRQEELMREEGRRREAAGMQIQQRLAAEDARIQTALDSIPQQDPNRFWNSKSGFDRTMGALAAGMAGFLNPGGKNVVVETAQQLIQDDLRAQETNIATARDRVGAMERGYNRLAGRLETDELMKREATLYKLETVKAGLAAKMAEFASPLTQAEIAGTIAELDAFSVQERSKLLELQNKTMLEQSNFELDRWYKNEQVKLRKGELDFAAGAQAAKLAAEANKPPNILEPKNVLGHDTGFKTTDGKSFIIPGETETERAARGEEFRRISGGAATALRAVKDLQDMDFDTWSKLSPTQRQERTASMSKAVLGMMSASGEGAGRLSDRDMAIKFSQLGGEDLTTMQTLFDSDGKVRKQLLADMYDEIIAGANMQARSSGKVVDEQANRERQRRGRELTLDELDAAGLLKDAMYEPPVWAKELRVSAENPVEGVNNLRNTAVKGVGPGTSGTEESKTTIPRAQALLKDAKAGKWDQDPEIIRTGAEAMRDMARQFKDSKTASVKEKAVEAAELSGQLMKTYVERKKNLAKSLTVEHGQTGLNLSGQPAIINTPAESSQRTLTDDELRDLSLLPPIGVEARKRGYVRSAPSNK
jgi:murein DD-endopeptidase MepM/ murein hydrolase activator NlpD